MRNVNYYFEIVLNKGRTKSDLKFKWYKLKSLHPLLRKMEIANKSKMNSELFAIVKLLYFYFLALRGFNADQIFLIILLHNAFQFICTTPTNSSQYVDDDDDNNNNNNNNNNKVVKTYKVTRN